MDIEEESNENTCFKEKDDFLYKCLRLVARGKLPSSIFDDSDFKSLIEIHEKRHGTNLNSSSIESMLDRCDKEGRSAGMECVESELVSLSFHHFYQNPETKGFIGISMNCIQYQDTLIQYLGFIALPKPFSGSELKTEILKFLENHELYPNEIYATTTDRVITLRNKELDESEWCELQDLNQKIHDCIAELFPVFRCPAYHLQSAVNDVLSPVAQKITECRSLLKELEKMPGFDFKSSELRLCNRTDQWKSLHEMFASILKQKNLIDSVLGDANNQLTNIDWNFISDIVNVLGPLKDIFKHYRTSENEIGDYYKNWLACELQLEIIGPKNPFAYPLRMAMEKGRQSFFENDFLLASLYLDPRFNFSGSNILSQEQKTRAVDRLIKTFKALNSLHSNPENASESSATNPGAPGMIYIELGRRFKREIEVRKKLIELSEREMVPIDTCFRDMLNNHRHEHEGISEIYFITITMVACHYYAKCGFDGLPDGQIQTLSGADVKRLNHLINLEKIWTDPWISDSNFFKIFE